MNVPTIPTLRTVDLLAVKITKSPDGDENEFEDGDQRHPWRDDPPNESATFYLAAGRF